MIAKLYFDLSSVRNTTSPAASEKVCIHCRVTDPVCPLSPLPDNTTLCFDT